MGLIRALTAFPLFMLLDTKIPIVIFLSLFVNLVSRAAIAGGECAWFCEFVSNKTKLRFSGFAVGREWPSIMGGIAPVFAQAIVAKTQGGWWPIAVMCVVVSILGFISSYYSPEMRNLQVGTKSIRFIKTHKRSRKKEGVTP